ncbi:MAG TPA: ATP-binding protein [Gaiellaceae bacterium]|nr:ATP-binding protein [Gaiellaceae bacterium]
MAIKRSADADARRLGDLLGRLGARRQDARPALALARSFSEGAASRAEARKADAIGLIGRIADVLAQLALDHAWRRSDIGKIADTVARISGLPGDVVRRETHGRLARDPRVIALSPLVAVETELKIFYALTGVDEVSLWTRNGAGPSCLISVGKVRRRTRLVARGVLEESGEGDQSGGTYGLPVLRWQRREAALVFSSDPEGADLALSSAREATAALTLVLEREALLLRSAAHERALVQGAERLLARLGFDLHDGPIQDIAALAADLRFLRDQLQSPAIAENGSSLLTGRIDDLQARVSALDGSLRDIVHSLESPVIAQRPLDRVIRREIETFRTQTDIAIDLTLSGGFSSLSASQRIALVRIVQEALTNVREHSRATKVSVVVTSRANSIEAEITDNGRGFDVERTLVRAARNGRVGLLGMSERTRLLGGSFDVRSSPGGPTAVSVVLPAWRPATATGARQAAEVQSAG